MPSLFDFAPGGVYPASDVAAAAVRFYRTLSPLPGQSQRRFAFCGTVPKIAFAGRYPAPFLAGARTFLPHIHKDIAAAARPSGKMAISA
jgi:hypothetical protein